MAKKTLWQRIKAVFSGNNSAKSSGSSGSSKRTNYYSSSRKDGGTGYYRRAMLNSLTGKEEEEKPRYKSMAEAVKSTSKVTSKDKGLAAAIDAKTNKFGTQNGVKKEPPTPSTTSKHKPTHKENLEKLNTQRKEKLGAYHEATHHRYDVAEKGISKEERERRKQNIRTAPMGEMMFGRDDEAVDVAKAKMKYDKVRTSAERGAANTFTLGAVDLAEKRLAKGNRKEAEDIYQENKSKGAETLGSLAGGLAIWGGTAKGFEDIGSKAVGKAATTELGKKLGAEKLAKVMAGEGAKAALARSLVGDTIQDSTMGAVDTAMDIAARDDLETPGDYLKAFAKGQAANYAMGLAGNAVGQALPVAGKAVRKAWGNFADESRKLRIVPKGVDEVGAKGTKSAAENLTPKAETKTDILRGYSSTGSKKKLSEAQKRINQLVADGDTKAAREEIDRVVDDVVRSTKNVSPVDNTIKEIKEELKNTRISVSSKDKVDAGYLSGGYNEFRKGNFGSLKLTEDGRPVDDLWLSLQERYGKSLFPDEIDTPSEQLQYLSDLVKRKGDVIDLMDDEIANLKTRLSENLWETANKGREHAPFDMRDEDWAVLQEASRPTSPEELLEIERRAIESGDIDPNVRANSTPEEAYRESLKEDIQSRAKELGEEPGEWGRAKTPDELVDEPLRVDRVADETYMPGPTPGVAKSRSAYEYATGEEYVGTDVRTSWDEAWKADQEYHRSHSYGQTRAHSKTSVTQLQAATSDEQRRLIEEAVKRGDIDYNRIHTEEAINKAARNFHSDPDRYVKDLIDFNNGNKTLSYKDTPEWSAMAHYIMAVIDPSADPSSEIAFTEAYKLASDIASKAGQAQNLRRHFVHLTPAGRRDSIMDELASMLYNSRGFNNLHPDMPKDKYDALHYIRAYLEDDPIIEEKVKNLVKASNLDSDVKLGRNIQDAVDYIPFSAADEGAEGLAKGVGESTDNYAEAEGGIPGIDDIDVAHLELIEALNAHRPKTGFDVLQQLRYMFMLLNPRTHFRNIGGSFLFSPMRQISNGFRSLIEKPLANNFDVDIARHGGPSVVAAYEARIKNPTSEAGKKAVEALEKRGKDFLGGLKYETEMWTGRAKTLPGKALDWLSDKNSWVLTKEDDHFKKIAFKENYIKSYNRYLKDKVPITPAIEKRIEEEAIQEAYIATFNEANDAAKALNRLTRQANDPHASIGARWFARYANAMMPFEKVPANITKQAINYSPLGLMRGAVDIAKAGRAGDAVALNKAIDELASGLTGTGVFVLGAWLQRRYGMFTTNTGKNDPGAKFKKDRGMQNYSVNFIDPETGKGTSITLDWLVPVSSVFFSGVEFANQMEKGDVDLMALGGDWATVVSRLAEPVLESSMLSGIHGALETLRGGYGDDDTKGAVDVLIREAAQSYLNSLVPTALGSAARSFFYDSELQLPNEENDWKYFKNQIKSKAGLGNTNILGEPLGPDTDAYGNIKGEHHGAKENLKYFLKVGVSPANIQKIDISQTDQEKLRIYEEAVKDGADPNDMAYLFPKKQTKKKFSVGGEDVNMSNREVSLYNQAKTKGGAEGMRYIMDNSIIYNRYDYDAKGNKIPAESAYTKEQKEALIRQFEGKSMREVEEWLYKDPMFRQASPAEQKKVIKNLWDLSKDSNAVASQRVGEQAVYKAQGKDVNEYNYKNEVTESKREKLDPYIASGLLTYGDIVDFERNGGKASFTEDDEGGSVKTYYSKASMIAYFVEHGIPYDKAEALYNSYKNKNAKPYSGNDMSSGKGGRRRYRSGGGGGGKAKVPTINAKSMAAATKSVKGTKVKLEPPTPKTTPKVTTKFRKYDI